MQCMEKLLQVEMGRKEFMEEIQKKKKKKKKVTIQ